MATGSATAQGQSRQCVGCLEDTTELLLIHNHRDICATCLNRVATNAIAAHSAIGLTRCFRLTPPCPIPILPSHLLQHYGVLDPRVLLEFSAVNPPKAAAAAQPGAAPIPPQPVADLDADALSRISVACPGCDTRIERADGCNHMTHSCNSYQTTHFCILCGCVLDVTFSSNIVEHGTSTIHYPNGPFEGCRHFRPAPRNAVPHTAALATNPLLNIEERTRIVVRSFSWMPALLLASMCVDIALGFAYSDRRSYDVDRHILGGQAIIDILLWLTLSLHFVMASIVMLIFVGRVALPFIPVSVTLLVAMGATYGNIWFAYASVLGLAAFVYLIVWPSLRTLYIRLPSSLRLLLNSLKRVLFPSPYILPLLKVENWPAILIMPWWLLYNATVILRMTRQRHTNLMQQQAPVRRPTLPGSVAVFIGLLISTTVNLIEQTFHQAPHAGSIVLLVWGHFRPLWSKAPLPLIHPSGELLQHLPRALVEEALQVVFLISASIVLIGIISRLRRYC